MHFPRELCTVGSCGVCVHALTHIYLCELLSVGVSACGFCVQSVCFKFCHMLHCLRLNNVYGACTPSFYCLTVNPSTPRELLANPSPYEQNSKQQEAKCLGRTAMISSALIAKWG